MSVSSVSVMPFMSHSTPSTSGTKPQILRVSAPIASAVDMPLRSKYSIILPLNDSTAIRLPSSDTTIAGVLRRYSLSDGISREYVSVSSGPRSSCSTTAPR